MLMRGMDEEGVCGRDEDGDVEAQRRDGKRACMIWRVRTADIVVDKLIV